MGVVFLFIDVGLEAFSPGMVTLIRVGLGAATLALFPSSRRPIDRSDWPRLFVVSVLWVAVPLSLFPIAQQWIDSAVAGMLNGTMPMLTALIAAAMLSGGARRPADCRVGRRLWRGGVHQPPHHR